MRGTDHWRVVGILPVELRDREDLTFKDVIPSVRQEAGADLSFKHCSWYSTYRIHHRCAARFRERRCFLLGDAAHIHSPVGAQGMNTGLQDAYNLAWKLALVVSGRADAALLDSYEAERIPVAKRLLSTTDRAFQLIVSDSRVAGLFRTRVLANVAAFAMRFDRVRKLAFRTISQIGIQYRDSPLSESQARWHEGAPRAGDRFPWLRVKLQADGPIEDLFAKLDDTRFNLLLIGQPSASVELPGLRDLLRIHACRVILSTTRSSHGSTSRSRLSFCSALTVMSGWRGLNWMLPKRHVTSPSVCTSGSPFGSVAADRFTLRPPRAASIPAAHRHRRAAVSLAREYLRQRASASPPHAWIRLRSETTLHARDSAALHSTTPAPAAASEH